MSSNVFVPTQFANQYAPSASFNRSYHPMTETSVPNRVPAPDHYNSDGSTVVLNYQPICLNIKNEILNNQNLLSDDDFLLYAPQSLNAPSVYSPQSLNAPSVYAPQSLNAPQQVYTQQPHIAYTQQPFYSEPSIAAPQPAYTHQQPFNQNNLSYNWARQPLDLNILGNMDVNNNWNTQPSGFNPMGNLSRSHLPLLGILPLQPNYSTQWQQPNFGIQQEQNFEFPQQSTNIPDSLNPWGINDF